MRKWKRKKKKNEKVYETVYKIPPKLRNISMMNP